ncbi:hypothetical protein [Desulfoscipio gibsoniae]|uniref:Uncharacterized protein n=1 Tax=Desulfoscipio gibsoniae DSM 7213 TaxID=767817 RepID=R4KM57_9FIRM|nr:hypothetical protein [Desulfoscipio gibsoniae]AGL01605.1 hypothetical protein Desgi_2174 [Desulfoscipio gibsoniae DSM 7213]
MMTLISQITNFINDLHDSIWAYSRHLGLPFTDKDLHFWIIGLLGVFFFIFTDVLFKWLAKFNVSLISFFFTSAIISILVLILEVEQKLTGRGGMELGDVLASLWGFLVLLGVYLFCRFLVLRLLGLIKKH